MEDKFINTTYLFKQQTMLLKFAEKQLALKPFASAMDKAGHFILLELETIDDFKKDKTCVASINAYTLGTHKDNSVDFVQVGRIYFTKFYDYPIDIITFYTSLKYKGNGIGKILLQAVENFAVENNVSGIMLHSMLNKTRLKDAKFPQPKDFDNIEDFELALREENSAKDDKYFDKNYYFYYSQGYSPAKLPAISQAPANAIPMVKTLLKFKPLTKAATNKIRKCNPTDERFQMTEFHRIKAAGPDSSNFEQKGIDTKRLDVKPFVLEPTEESFKNIYSTLNSNTTQEDEM